MLIDSDIFLSGQGDVSYVVNGVNKEERASLAFEDITPLLRL